MSEVQVGVVSDFFSRAMAAGIELSDTLRVGDTIRIKGHTTDMEVVVSSMQVDNSAVQEAQSGAAVGVHVPDRVRRGDKVFKVAP